MEKVYRFGIDRSLTGVVTVPDVAYLREGAPAVLLWNAGLVHRVGPFRHYWPKVIFSAKESVYKCYFPLARNYLDFQDVELHISPQSGQFSAMISAAAPPALSDVRVLCGRFAVNDTHVFTAITLTSAELNSSA